MITIDGQSYPSEVRASAAPPPQLDQEVPAGSSEPPGLGEVLGDGRTMVDGESLTTRAPGPVAPVPVYSQSGLYAVSGGLAPDLTTSQAGEVPREDRIGLAADPGGAGAPLRAPGTVADPGTGDTYENPNAPTLDEDPPLQPGEEAAGRAMLEEARGLYGEVTVLSFVRYPTERRLMMKFEEGTNPGEVRGLQRTY